LIAGFVALLPVAGLVLTIAWLESSLAASWLARQPFYFAGMGILAGVLALYLIGLLVTTFLGRWLFARFDHLMRSLPGVGALYRTLKQVLGYGSGDDALFQEVVLVESRDTGGHQIGLVTARLGAGDDAQLVVFVPGAPNPANGRMLILGPGTVVPIRLSVNESLKALVSLGKTSLEDLLLLTRR
jgi:uncharacterized membrane protein